MSSLRPTIFTNLCSTALTRSLLPPKITHLLIHCVFFRSPLSLNLCSFNFLSVLLLQLNRFLYGNWLPPLPLRPLHRPQRPAFWIKVTIGVHPQCFWPCAPRFPHICLYVLA